MKGHDREQPVAVNIGDCRCSGDPRPHPDGDVVYLAAHPSLRLGLAANAALASNITDTVEMMVALGGAFIRYGVVAWNLLNDQGQAILPTPAVVEERLLWDRGGREVADRAADLYQASIVDPWMAKLLASLPPGQTEDSTSPSLQLGESSPSSSPPSSPVNAGAGN